MTFPFFLSFEIAFFSFWLSVFYFQNFPIRDYLMAFFAVLMFSNGLWHLVWAGIKKEYVPGLVTAPLFVIAYLSYYFQIAID